ncbi:MAG: DUF998 domain-containing protein [Candidatus Bathyarchaeota archaeon]|nr:DUF998 domain-containing protein [Candidatus Bathyarchaeota archaeon]
MKVGGVAGVVAPVAAFICILIAIASYPAFSWVHNALSDLGVVSGLTGYLFNFGLFVGGLLAFIFSVFGLWNYFSKNLVGRVGALMFACASVALMAIGVFNEDFKPIHYLVSVAFFALATMALLVLTAGFFYAGKRALAVLSLAVGFFSASVWVLQLTISYVPNVAIPEFASGFAVSIWAVAVGRRMLKL